MDIKRGDVVRLKCGGPEMVVVNVTQQPPESASGIPTCDTMWHHDRTGEILKARIPAEFLFTEQQWHETRETREMRRGPFGSPLVPK